MFKNVKLEGVLKLLSIITLVGLIFMPILYIPLTQLFKNSHVVGGLSNYDKNSLNVKNINMPEKIYAAYLNKELCPQSFPLGMPKIQSQEVNQSSAILCQSKYAVQYSEDTKTPLWASHVLRKSDFTNSNYVERTDDFRLNPDVPEETQVKPSVYSRSGYDKGHLVPAADFSYNDKYMSESFLMTNIAPQAPNNNRKTWSNLEKSIRNLLKKNEINELYVTTGVLYLNDKNLGIINKKVKIPTHFYKVIVEPKSGFSAAYVVPNNNNVNPNFKNYLISISNLEKAAGIKFNSDLSGVKATEFVKNDGQLNTYLK